MPSGVEFPLGGLKRWGADARRGAARRSSRRGRMDGAWRVWGDGQGAVGLDGSGGITRDSGGVCAGCAHVPVSVPSFRRRRHFHRRWDVDRVRADCVDGLDWRMQWSDEAGDASARTGQVCACALVPSPHNPNRGSRVGPKTAGTRGLKETQPTLSARAGRARVHRRRFDAGDQRQANVNKRERGREIGLRGRPHILPSKPSHHRLLSTTTSPNPAQSP